MSDHVQNQNVGFLMMRLICQLMAKECTPKIGKLPVGGLARNCVVRITVRPHMTTAVYYGHKAQHEINN